MSVLCERKKMAEIYERLGSKFWVEDCDDSDDDNLKSLDDRIRGIRTHSDDMEVDSEPLYIAKCNSHHRRRQVVEDKEDEEELSEAGQNLVRSVIGTVRTDRVRCNCQNDRCKILRFLRKTRNKRSLSVDAGTQINDLNIPKSDFHFTKEEFLRIQEEIVRLAGGQDRADKIYNRIRELAKGSTRVDSSTRCNTALMQLCSTTFKDETDPTKASDRAMLYAQINALIKLYSELDPAALFVRNSQDAGALELAALTNKTVVTKYLAMLHTVHGRDVNAANEQGHTLLHLLARKGDDCSDTLEELLKMKVFSHDEKISKRLFRLDVLNGGKKTPLDVANACVDLFSTGKDRTLYTRVISIFHASIEDEASEMEAITQKRLTELNVF